MCSPGVRDSQCCQSSCEGRHAVSKYLSMCSLSVQFSCVRSFKLPVDGGCAFSAKAPLTSITYTPMRKTRSLQLSLSFLRQLKNDLVSCWVPTTQVTFSIVIKKTVHKKSSALGEPTWMLSLAWGTKSFKTKRWGFSCQNETSGTLGTEHPEIPGFVGNLNVWNQSSIFETLPSSCHENWEQFLNFYQCGHR